MTDTINRFSDRVNQYVKYRPSYPQALIRELVAALDLNPRSRVADLGSGSGIFTRLLLDQGLRVFGVEPNTNMRVAAEKLLTGYAKFTSIDACAEDTGLETDSIDLITAAQAFHWFHNNQANVEFRRILKPSGKLALIWNQRKISQPFQHAYDAVLREMVPQYGIVNHMTLSDDEIAHFFGDDHPRMESFANQQRLDFAGLLGRLQSASYCPAIDSDEYRRLASALEVVFAQHATNDYVEFEYETRLFIGAIDA